MFHFIDVGTCIATLARVFILVEV